jgi:tyrocidine synthetase III
MIENLHTTFEGRARQFPNRTALEETGREISYSELNARVNTLAHVLLDLGIKKDVIAACILPSGIELVTSLLACFKAGGIYLPIDISFPKKRLLQVFNQTFSGIIITNTSIEKSVKSLIEELNINIRYLVVLDDEKIVVSKYDSDKEVDFYPLQENLSADNPNIDIQPDDSNYIFYTSGSTGEGKAILGSHKSLSHFINWEIREFAIDHTSRISQIAQPTFDASLKDILTAVCAGGTLCIPSAEARSNSILLVEWIDSTKLTVLQCVPSIFREILKALDLMEEKRKLFTSLKNVLLAGEMLYAKDLLKCRRLIGEHVEIINLYGATESTVLKTFHRIKVIPENPSQIIHVGKAISDTSVAVINDGHICRTGEKGEVYIKTNYLTKGYINNETLNKLVFIQNPLVKNRADIVYKTGDIGRYLADGNIEILGRIDHQVKINGVRVELGEIEGAVLKIKGIDEVVIMAHLNPENQYEIVCYYTNPEIKASDIRIELKNELAENSIPNHYIWLEKFPQNSNGKINKRLLPKPESQLRQRQSFEACVSVTENELEIIWQQVLNIHDIGRSTSFWDLGGNSLKAMQILTRIYKTFSIGLKITDIFSNTTIEKLAKVIDNTKETVYYKIEPVPDNAHYEVSHSQKRLWVLSQFEGEKVAFNMHGAYVFHEGLDRKAFAKAFQTLINRHESLRTTFIAIGGEPKQKIHTITDHLFNFDYQDLQNEVSPMREAERLVKKEPFIPFDLENGPLLRVKLLQVEIDKFIFLFTIHHIIADEWSMEVLVREILHLYHNYSAGKDNDLPALKIQYKDYTAWQNKQLTGEKLEEHRNYWFQQLSKEIPVLALPTDYPRPAIKTYNGNRLSFILNKETTNGLKELGQKNGASLFVVVLAIIKALVYRYTHQNDIIIGSPVAGRDHLDLEDQIGFYINMLPLRTVINGNEDFESLLNQVKITTLNGLNHQVYPFDKLVDELNIPRDTSRSVLYDLGFTWHSIIINDDDADSNLSFKKYQTDFITAKADLWFHGIESNEEIILFLEYNTDLFKKERIEHCVKHFETLANAIQKNSKAPLNQLEYLTAEEKKNILIDFNATKTPYPSGTIQKLFEEQVQRSPEAVAIVYADKILTYAELNEKANHLAHYLRKNYKIKADDLIGLMVDRSERMIIGLLAILKSGAGYVPIDPEYPKKRIAYFLSDSKIKVLLTDSDKIFDLVEDYQGELFALDVQLPHLQESDSNPEITNTSDDLAYIIYTSGTTGVPKGVMINHKSVVRLVKNTNYVSLHSRQKLLQTGSISFDAMTFEVWGMLLNGGELHLMAKEELLEVPLLRKKLLEDSISIIWLTSSWFNQLADTDIHLFSKLDRLLIGGEELSPKHINKVRDAYPSLTVMNCYGPTENTTFSTAYNISTRHDYSIPIGRPISNSTAYILDENGMPLPVGVSGEIYLGGDGLARGYWNQAALSKEKFVENVFEVDQKLYRTGDLGRWTSEGTIEFEGRKDSQVKIRGYRIELKEIEVTLLKHEEIEEGAVIVGGEAESFIVAYYVSNNDLSESLREFILGTLPSYMLPSYFVRMEQLPLTSNGKLDRERLPDPEGSNTSGIKYAQPVTELQERLVDIWQNILGAEKIGIHDNFFDLGGHSLKAIRVVSDIYKMLNIKIELSSLFTCPTIEKLSAAISGLKKVIYQSITPLEKKEYYDISPAQRRLWIFNQFEETKSAYNIPAAYILMGKVNTAALEKSFVSLIERHEILRTIFITVDGIPKQKICTTESCGFKFDYSDFRDKEGREAEAKVLASDEAAAEFDLANGPLLRLKLLQLEDEVFVFLFTMHHIISDEWSMEILFKEFLKLYQDYNHGIETHYPPLKIQYKDYSAWQNAELSGEKLKTYRAYWHEKLKKEIPLLEFPSDYVRPRVKSYDGATIDFVLDKELSYELKVLSQKYGISTFMVMIACLKALLYNYTKQEDIIIGTPISGREHADLENQLGFYINMLAIRTQFNGNESFESLLIKVKESILGAYDHQSYPFDQLVDELNLERDLSRSVLFDVGFAWHTQANVEVTDSTVDFEVKQFGASYQIAKGDIWFHGMERGGNIHLSVIYNTSLFKKSRMERLIAHYRNSIAAIVKNVLVPLHSIDYITTEEKAQQLCTFNNNLIISSVKNTIHELFELQVTKTADQPAVIFNEKCLTYLELNAKANQLAHYLRDKYDILPDDPIVLLLKKSEVMIIGILGALKAGGAYVPVDPDYPLERIQFIINDISPKVIITDGELAGFTDLSGADLYVIGDEILEYPETNPENISTSGHLAYIIYTSGSTGIPKGVMIEHRSYLNLNNQYFDFDEYKNGSLTCNYTFDVSVLEIFSCVLKGGTLYLPLSDVIINPEKYAEFLFVNKINTVYLHPMHVSSIAASLSGYDTVYLKNILIGVEPIRRSDVQWYFDNNVKIINGYGPTEAAIVSTMYSVIAENDDQEYLPIGKPVSKANVYILNENNKIEPVGIDGEICIEGEGLARGYWDRTELTALKFINSPINFGTKLYKTGDLGRWLENGNILFRGRKDTQVKIRGHRIELGEIENVLSSMNDIINVVCVVKEDQQEDKYLIAYFVSSQKQDLSGLRNYLGERLPGYMIPSYFVQLDEIPLTPNGKTHYKSLPEPQLSALAGDVFFYKPGNKIEEELVSAWCEVLKQEQLGIRSNFFEIGGNSIKAIQVVSRIEKTLNVQLSLRDIFDYPTVELLAKKIASLVNKKYDVIPLAEKNEWYEISHAQKRLWLLHQYQQTQEAYNMPSAYEIKGVLDITALEWSLKALVNRHEILRTTFITIEGEPKQKVHESIPSLKMVYIDLRNDELKIEKAKLMVKEEASTPFNLADGPLLRVKLLQLEEQSYVFLLTIHHIIADGWSMEIVIKELLLLYSAYFNEKENALLPLSVQYKDYAAWHNNLLTGENLKKLRLYWLNQFEDLPVFEFPTDHARSGSTGDQGDSVRIAFTYELTNNIKALSHKYNTTLFMTLLASVNVLFYKYTGEDDIVLGTNFAGREHNDLKNQIGFYLNTLPLRVRFKGEENFADLLQKVRETTLGAYEHQQYPFDVLVSDLNLQRQVGRNPLFDIEIELQSLEYADSGNSLENIAVKPYHNEYLLSKDDLSFSFIDSDQLFLIIRYKTGLFARDTIQRMMSHYHQILNSLAQDCNISLDELEYLSEEEHKALAGFNKV